MEVARSYSWTPGDLLLDVWKIVYLSNWRYSGSTSRRVMHLVIGIVL